GHRESVSQPPGSVTPYKHLSDRKKSFDTEVNWSGILRDGNRSSDTTVRDGCGRCVET
ncbi:MAG: hypothetical protein ACI8S6_005475, partial [Myxococcota bacterium]